VSDEKRHFVMRVMAIWAGEDELAETLKAKCDEIQRTCALAGRVVVVNIELVEVSPDDAALVEAMMDRKTVRELVKGVPIELSGNAAPKLRELAERLAVESSGATDGAEGGESGKLN
jgi:tRNA(Ile2) C34 agmatinyltransferase TiaS